MKTFLALLYVYTLSQFYRSFLAVVAGDLARDIGLDAAQLGSVSAAWFAAFAVAQFPVGVMLDRFGPRWTLAGLLLAAVGGAVWLSAATTFAGCVAAMALIGVGCAPALMASMYVFARTYSLDRFALLSSTIIGLGTVGNLLGATPLALAVETIGWRASVLVIAAATAAGVFLVAAVLRDPPRVEAEGGATSMFGGLGIILGLRPLWLLIPLVAVSYAVVIALRSLWIAPYLDLVWGLGVAERGHAALAMGLAMSLGALAYGPLERLFGAKSTTLAGAFVTALALLALAFMGDDNLPLAIGLLAAIGAAGTSYAILMAHAREFMPAHLLGRGVTFINFIFIGGAGLVQWLSGRFVQASAGQGISPALTYERLFLSFGIALLAACALYAFAPGGRRSPRPAAADLSPAPPAPAP